jgi:hypothetical protein
MYLDSLRFCEPFYPNLFQDHRVELDDYVNFNTNNLLINWIGISKKNDKICALISFKGMYNPIDADTKVMDLKGRSCFWGEIWVSLSDRQIEYGLLNEDVIIEMRFKENGSEHKVNLQRQLILERI